MNATSIFWDDLAKDLENQEFRREYILESLRIQTIDEIVNSLDEARIAAHLSKADIARAIDADPAVIRRLFSTRGNPTLSRVAEIASALGMRLSLEPLAKPAAAALSEILARPAPRSLPGTERKTGRKTPRDIAVPAVATGTRARCAPSGSRKKIGA